MFRWFDDAKWFDARSSLFIKQLAEEENASLVKRWLYDKNSLTQKLNYYFPNKMSIRCLAKGGTKLSLRESKILRKIKIPSRSTIREVQISIENNPVIFARTVIPLASLVQKNKAMKRLNHQSLGSVIFTDTKWERRWESFGYFPVVGHSLPQSKLYGRCSIFIFRKKPIIITEFFLPLLWDKVSAQGRI